MTPEEHAADVTAKLRADDPPLGMSEQEVVCPRCTLVFFIPTGVPFWGVCPDCVGEAIGRTG